jgi:hypothetical protein
VLEQKIIELREKLQTYNSGFDEQFNKVQEQIQNLINAGMGRSSGPDSPVKRLGTGL